MSRSVEVDEQRQIWLSEDLKRLDLPPSCFDRQTLWGVALHLLFKPATLRIAPGLPHWEAVTQLHFFSTLLVLHLGVSPPLRVTPAARSQHNKSRANDIKAGALRIWHTPWNTRSQPGSKTSFEPERLRLCWQLPWFKLIFNSFIFFFSVCVDPSPNSEPRTATWTKLKRTCRLPKNPKVCPVEFHSVWRVSPPPHVLRWRGRKTATAFQLRM